MYKLVLIFGEDSDLSDVPKCLVFNNHLDAEKYLEEQDCSEIKIVPENTHFSFYTKGWRGSGSAYWATAF